MDFIFHEKQEGSLCAQHCLNNLLQAQYFSAVDLADLAKQLDAREMEAMSQGGMTDDFRRFMQQPSGNLDDSGFFSIQVLEKALAIWNLELVIYKGQSDIAKAARNNPTDQQAYICNFKEHWFTIRKLGNQWFNLNSLLTGPELISDTYLSLFLTQLEQEGYSIFIVIGNMPDCDSHQALLLTPAVQPVKPQLITSSGTAAASEDMDDDLQAVIAASKHEADMEDTALQRALAMSMQGDASQTVNTLTEQDASTSKHSSHSFSSKESSISPPETDHAEVRAKRLAYLEKIESKSNPKGNDVAPDDCNSVPEKSSVKPISEMSEEDMLKEAMKLSMQKL